MTYTLLNPELTRSPAESVRRVSTPAAIRDDLTTWVVFGLLGVLALSVAVAVFAPASNEGIRDATAALGLIGATAVGIERILEVFWNFIDTTRGSFWPLTAIDKKINQLVDEISDQVSGPLQQLKSVVADSSNIVQLSKTELGAFTNDVNEIAVKVSELKQLAPTSDNAQAIASYTTQALAALAKRYPIVNRDCDAAIASVAAIGDFVNSLTDNPGRRIISIYLGSLMGLIVALALGLDMFHATLGTALTNSILVLSWSVTLKWGIAATGVIMGLGANPTHELIKVLQTYKENRKSS